MQIEKLEAAVGHALIDVATLKNLAASSNAVSVDWHCKRRDLAGWADWPVGFHEQDFKQLGTLARHAPEESTINEYHPAGTSYWLSNAPIAPRYYPYNQSTVWQCAGCERIYLRHNDDGAYHVAPRVRFVNTALIVDAPHAQDGRESS